MTETNESPPEPPPNVPRVDVATVHQTGAALLSMETQSFWQINLAHLVALTLLAGFLSSQGNPLYVLFAIAMGLAVAFSWQGCIKRINSWAEFRVAQLKRLENDMPHDSLKLVTQADKWDDRKGHPIRKAMVLLAYAFMIFFVAAGVVLSQPLWRAVPIGPYQIAPQANTENAWVVDTTTGQLRLCAPPAKAGAAPECWPWTQ